MRTVAEMVKDNQKVRLQMVKDGYLYYQTECDFMFPVPPEDQKGATFLLEDKALLFMRWIRKEVARIEAGKAECA